MSPRVFAPPRHEPAPEVTPNLHVAAANWARGRAKMQAEVDWEAWRERAREIRADAVRHLPELIERLEERVTAAGGHIHHAATGAQANAHVARICAEHGARTAVKSKSITTEETGLNDALAAAGVEAVETDFGEYVVDERPGDRSSHILAPAVHLSVGQVAELFSEQTGERFDPDDAGALVAHARRALRERFLDADVGITGVNFAVAQTGTLIVIESEGNVRLCSSLPRVHVAVMGIEKVLRDWEGAAHMVEMLPMAAIGERASGYASYITGPARDGDDGPRELHLVLLDDGRSAIRGTAFEEALQCIRCGACLNACPVYRQVGGHAYGTAYSGPIGAVITPLLEGGADDTDDLAWLSSLCGACAEACPVKIPLDDHLAWLRADARERDPHRAEAALFAAWARLWSRTSGYRATAATGGRALGPLWAQLARADAGDGWERRAPFPFSRWTDGRDVRAPAAEPFHMRWRRARGG